MWITPRKGLFISEREFLKISVLTKDFRSDRLWLVDLEALHEPPELLPRKGPRFLGAPRPLVPSSGGQPLIIEDKAVLIEVERLDPVAAFPAEEEQGIAERIQTMGLADDRAQTVYGLPHIGVACDQVDLCYAGQFA